MSNDKRARKKLRDHARLWQRRDSTKRDASLGRGDSGSSGTARWREATNTNGRSGDSHACEPRDESTRDSGTARNASDNASDSASDSASDNASRDAASMDQLNQSVVRLKVARMLRRGGETLCVDGEARMVFVNSTLAVVVRRGGGTVELHGRCLPCSDPGLRMSLAAVPSEPFAFAEFRVDTNEKGLLLIASVDLSTQQLFREEMQLLRSEFDLRIAHLRRAVEACEPARGDRER